MSLPKLRGMRYEVIRVHDSGHVDVYLYRGARGRVFAVARWRSEYRRYWVARVVLNTETADGVWLPDLAACIRHAKGWE